MDKKALIARIREALKAELATVQASAADARAAATHEEAKPENEYDTRGLEASYLAGAQAGRAADLAHRIADLEFVPVKAFGPEDPVGLTALLELDDGERVRRYFLAPDGGGMKLDVDGRELLVITPKSPVGRAVLEKRAGDVVEFRLRGKTVEMEIVGLE